MGLRGGAGQPAPCQRARPLSLPACTDCSARGGSSPLLPLGTTTNLPVGLRVFRPLVAALVRVSGREALARHGEIRCRRLRSPSHASRTPLLWLCPGAAAAGDPSSRCVASAVPPVPSAPWEARPAPPCSCSLPRALRWSPGCRFAKLITEPRRWEMEHFLKALFGNNFHITRKRVMTELPLRHGSFNGCLCEEKLYLGTGSCLALLCDQLHGTAAPLPALTCKTFKIFSFNSQAFRTNAAICSHTQCFGVLLYLPPKPLAFHRRPHWHMTNSCTGP